MGRLVLWLDHFTVAQHYEEILWDETHVHSTFGISHITTVAADMVFMNINFPNLFGNKCLLDQNIRQIVDTMDIGWCDSIVRNQK